MEPAVEGGADDWGEVNFRGRASGKMLTLFGFEGIRFFVDLRVCSLKTAQKKKKRSQANKGIRWMPRRQEPKKDAVSCEKPRGTASKS
ncbi:hypothetical protein Lal_00008412 [Lupinus albus]|nr:hypothetical protein Lal_00008412 [Lupinus albus]